MGSVWSAVFGPPWEAMSQVCCWPVAVKEKKICWNGGSFASFCEGRMGRCLWGGEGDHGCGAVVAQEKMGCRVCRVSGDIAAKRSRKKRSGEERRVRGCGFVWPAERGEGRWWNDCLRVKWETGTSKSVWERWGKRQGSVEEEERMSGCLLLAGRGGKGGGVRRLSGFWPKERGLAGGLGRKKNISKGRGCRIVFIFKRSVGATARVRVFMCFPQFLFVSLAPVNFSPPFVYGWRFTYIENLYTCYLWKY